MRMRSDALGVRLWRSGTGIVIGCVVGAACISDRPTAESNAEPQPNEVAVAIENFAFVPGDIRLASGTTVVWTNRDEVVHTVSANDERVFDSEAFGQGQRFRFTAGSPGTYAYFCRIHPFMQATLVVVP